MLRKYPSRRTDIVQVFSDDPGANLMSRACFSSLQGDEHNIAAIHLRAKYCEPWENQDIVVETQDSTKSSIGGSAIKGTFTKFYFDEGGSAGIAVKSDTDDTYHVPFDGITHAYVDEALRPNDDDSVLDHVSYLSELYNAYVSHNKNSENSNSSDLLLSKINVKLLDILSEHDNFLYHIEVKDDTSSDATIYHDIYTDDFTFVRTPQDEQYGASIMCNNLNQSGNQTILPVETIVAIDPLPQVRSEVVVGQNYAPRLHHPSLSARKKKLEKYVNSADDNHRDDAISDAIIEFDSCLPDEMDRISTNVRGNFLYRQSDGTYKMRHDEYPEAHFVTTDFIKIDGKYLLALSFYVETAYRDLEYPDEYQREFFHAFPSSIDSCIPYIKKEDHPDE